MMGMNVNEFIVDFCRLFDVVVLNAGILLPAKERTEDGFEATFQVNFLGHFLLIDGIIAHQCPAHPVKVVTLTSIMHRQISNTNQFGTK